MQWRISALVMLHLRVLLPVSVNPDTREYFAEDIQIVKPVPGLFSDVCCRVKVRGRHAGTYPKSRKMGAANIMEKRIGEEQRWEGQSENCFISYGTCCIFSGITQDIMKAAALSLSARGLCTILTLKNGRCFDG